MRFSPEELKVSLNGLLAFALTPMLADGSVDCVALQAHVEMLIGRGCAAIFPAGGTGEFFSLTPEEYRRIVEATVKQTAGRVPVVAGAGYGTAIARSFARAAEEAGADGVLVLPPYLVESPQEGLSEHYIAVASAVDLGVIIYQRDRTRFEPATLERIVSQTNVVGFKDGVGEVERLFRIRRVIGDRLVYLNGMPTAEMFAQSLSPCGVTGYSSAILTFMPEIADQFNKAFIVNDVMTMNKLLDKAVIPFAEIRNRVPGYAVSLVKAGARLRGIPVGSVRTPLVDPLVRDEVDLQNLLQSLELSSPLGPTPVAAI